MVDVVIVYWKDHYSLAGWHEVGDTYPAGHTNISVGFLLTPSDDGGDYMTLAQTCYEDTSTVADVLYILKRDVTKVKVLESDEDAFN